MKDLFFKLVLVTNKNNKPTDEYLRFVSSCANSGITAVQLREKNLSYKDLLEFGKQLQTVLSPVKIPLIVNDNIELAIELDAAGVHLGQTDGDPIAARRQLGENKIIGLSIDSIAQLRVANTLPIDYIGVGAIYPTKNKANVTTIWGDEILKQIALMTKHTMIAIGGINAFNAVQVMRTGVDGIAAIGAFHDALDPSAVTKKLRTIIENINHATTN